MKKQCEICKEYKLGIDCGRKNCVYYGDIQVKEILIFPHTIGNRTFYTRKELEDYVLLEQKKYRYNDGFFDVTII